MKKHAYQLLFFYHQIIYTFIFCYFLLTIFAGLTWTEQGKYPLQGQEKVTPPANDRQNNCQKAKKSV